MSNFPDDRLDILSGYDDIAGFLGWKPSAVRYRSRTGELPVFHLGRTPCARRGTLRAWAAETEARGLRQAAGRRGA